MIERENVLRDFLLSTISGETRLSNYLHIFAKGVVPVEDLMESMIWTILQRRSGTNTMIQTSMGLLFMNLSAFAENINRGASGQDELVFHALQYIESHYIASTLVESLMTAIGYDNNSFFYRRFRERYGCSPREFRGNVIRSQ